MKFALCNEMYQDRPFDRVCEHVAACGYDGIEIAPFTLNDDPSRITESQARQVGKTAEAAGLEVTGVHWLLAKPAGLHLTSSDEAVRRRTVEFAQHLARLCAAMGGEVMVWGSPKQRDVAKGESHEAAFGRATEAIRVVCEVAGPLGVTVALEPLGPDTTNFMVYAADTIELIRAVDHPACRLHLDVKAMAQEPEPIPQVIEANADHLAYFHANDANLRGPGFGETDFVPIAAALKKIDYTGYVSVEVFDYKPDPETIARESLAYLKKTFKEAGAI